MTKIFHEYGLSGLRTCVVGFGSVNLVSNAIKKTKPQVRRVFTRGNSRFMVNLLDFTKHLFRDGEMNFLRDISGTTQCQQEFVLD